VNVRKTSQCLRNDIFGFGTSPRSCVLSRLTVTGSLDDMPTRTPCNAHMSPRLLQNQDVETIYPEDLLSNLAPLFLRTQAPVLGFELNFYLISGWSGHGAPRVIRNRIKTMCATRLPGPTLVATLQLLKTFSGLLEAKCKTARIITHVRFSNGRKIFVTENMKEYNEAQRHTALKKIFGI
jgi:hypothetical protein